MKQHAIFDLTKKLKDKKASDSPVNHGIESASLANIHVDPGTATAPPASQEPAPVTVETREPVPEPSSALTAWNKPSGR